MLPALDGAGKGRFSQSWGERSGGFSGGRYGRIAGENSGIIIFPGMELLSYVKEPHWTTGI